MRARRRWIIRTLSLGCFVMSVFVTWLWWQTRVYPMYRVYSPWPWHGFGIASGAERIIVGVRLNDLGKAPPIGISAPTVLIWGTERGDVPTLPSALHDEVNDSIYFELDDMRTADEVRFE